MRRLRMRGKITAAMVLAVVCANAALILLTVGWAADQVHQARASMVQNSVGADVDVVATTLAEHPEIMHWADFVDVGAGVASGQSGVQALALVVPRGTEKLNWSRSFQYRINSETPLVEELAGCLPQEAPARPDLLAPGSSMWSGDTCGGFVMGIGVAAPGSRTGPAWVLVHAARQADFDDPLPGLLTALIVAAGVVGLAVAGVASAVAKRLARPLVTATAMASAVAAGESRARIPIVGEDEVGELSEAVNTMADRLTAQIEHLESANQAQRQFVSDVAHELRTPTTALLASAAALDDPRSRDEAAALVAPQLRRLAGLTEDLLEISRMDAGRADLVADRIDLADLMAEVIVDSGAVDRISYTGPSELPITTDPARLRVVLRNLVANALQHGEPPVIVTAASDDRQLTVGVHDRGAGVPQELRSRVFDRFVRGDESRHGASSGLGLAIAAENAKLLGGELSLEPDGATFVLRLPSRST